METLTGYWNTLDTRSRGLLVGGIAALAVVLVILSRVATAPSYALLYSGLEPSAAGEVVAALEARGVPYQVNGTAIEVDANQRDALRMSLAGEGLPANGPQGYELLDQLSGFGTTSQMFDAAYWRAREGELSRTIVASPRIRAARVHIANPSADPFQPTREVTASVALRPASGGLTPGHAQALRYLVASSVPGLTSENVTVIDADSGHIFGADDRMSPGADAMGRATDLRESIERILAARVGPGNAVVQVSVELDTSRETIVERRIDPESRVVVATESEARDNTSRDAASGAVTVASNLPDGDASGDGGTSSAQTSEQRESVTFDMSETQRQIAREPGTIRRISVAVLLNGVPEPDADGQVRLVPRPAAELQALEALVRSAVGFDEARGDRVTVDSMAFDEAVIAEIPPPGFFERANLDLGQLVRTFVLAFVALVIAFGLIRPALRSASENNQAVSELAPSLGLPPEPAIPPLSDNAADQGPDPAAPAPVDFETMPNFPQIALPDLDAAFGPGDTIEIDPVMRLKRLIEEREEETVDILRSWMDEDEDGPHR